jgi:hypothetical protein
MLEARMSFVFEPAPQAFATIDAGGRFPIRRIFCVGRNYADHVREMGNDPKSEPPIFFTKPGDAVVPTGAAIPYALNTENLHYEVELVLAIGKTGVNLAEADGVTLTANRSQLEAQVGANIANPDYFHKVVDCQWACPAHTPVPEYIR